MPHVLLCLSHLRFPARPDGSIAAAFATDEAAKLGLGWIQYEHLGVRLDLVEGDYQALGAAYRWIRQAPDLLFAQAEEWSVSERRFRRMGVSRLKPRSHQRTLIEQSTPMLSSRPDDLADLLAKLAFIQKPTDWTPVVHIPKSGAAKVDRHAGRLTGRDRRLVGAA